MKAENTISKKKPFYPVNTELSGYLNQHFRVSQIPIYYDLLLEFQFSNPLLDKYGEDTLWETVYYPPAVMEELDGYLTQVYGILKVSGNAKVIQHLSVERVDYCMFGNSQPFRVRIKNNINDNYDYFYVKRADASRIYGLELEHLLSPNRINYMVSGDTLIEEHVAGIPGDQFLRQNLFKEYHNETRIAKEFVKFNERSFLRLLGDMRAYNFVMVVTPDFDDLQYRIRAIDFDQQCYEGRKNLYLPQYFKENKHYVDLCARLLTPAVVKQYQTEERSLMSRRFTSDFSRVNQLLDVMENDIISEAEKVETLRDELAEHYQSSRFKSIGSMGGLIRESLTYLSH